jgi:hypothetical protein
MNNWQKHKQNLLVTKTIKRRGVNLIIYMNCFLIVWLQVFFNNNTDGFVGEYCRYCILKYFLFENTLK